MLIEASARLKPKSPERSRRLDDDGILDEDLEAGSARSASLRRAYSDAAAREFPLHSIDAVFIDGDHTRAGVEAEARRGAGGARCGPECVDDSLVGHHACRAFAGFGLMSFCA